MRFEQERKESSIKQVVNIATIIGVFIAALTFLFGSGIMLPLLTDYSTPLSVEKNPGKATALPSNSRIHIENVSLAENGFYYQDPNADWFVNMENLVLTGNFIYSPELSKDEQKVWSHSGYLLDSDGVLCYEEEATFWSDYVSLQFAVDLPENIEAGTYTCVLHHFVNDQQICASVQFEIS